ncbi:hypothetical protein AAOE16_01190 [Ekhidna sp. MALMAid0563]|uniref:hypothetical protein n=1 Tax=Ekhidna sp. MALMAid0563 TaxID=3143937 RepID=UPI0032DFF6FB
MKRKLFTALAIVAALSFTACSEDAAMEELIQDTELNAITDGDGDDDDSGSPDGN